MIDALHSKIDPFDQPLVHDIWNEKYRYQDEINQHATIARVCNGVNIKKSPGIFDIMQNLLLMPGGRIIAGANTAKRVTLINCFVMPQVPDNLKGINQVLSDSLITMQRGGGIGMEFSLLRPKGSWLNKTQAIASGPLPFMDLWDAGCQTIKSAGGRRGAMMAILRCDHPDIEEFIEAKHVEGRLTNFNVSVGITDKFMEAVAKDIEWQLIHEKFPKGTPMPHNPDKHKITHTYKTIRARDLWDKILKSTYVYAEPGLVFIDRMNNWNNLYYCEDIYATNPCGEQPLPSNGACDLSAINLSRLVKNPFTHGAVFDRELFKKCIHAGIDFLDQVLDVTDYPLEAQRLESMQKRRLGLGIGAIASLFSQMCISYGDTTSVAYTESVFHDLANESYRKSALLAKERGAFPLYDERMLESPVIKRLDEDVQDLIKDHGLRNGTLTTVAPIGTGSIFYGNLEGGIEPAIAHSQIRKVLQEDDSKKEYIARSYTSRLYRAKYGCNEDEDFELPEYMNTIKTITVEEHIAIQAAAQPWIDASITKTVNCPEDMEFEDFKNVYNLAWEKGLKGCTTYRPSGIRGNVLSDADEKPEPIKKDYNINPGGEEGIHNKTVPATPAKWKRPKKLPAYVYQIKWAHSKAAVYLTIADDGKRMREIFISSKDNKHLDWTMAFTRTVSAVMRLTPDIKFLTDELQEVASVSESMFIDQKHYSSLVAYIGHLIEQHGKSLQDGDAGRNTGWEAAYPDVEKIEKGIENLDFPEFSGNEYEVESSDDASAEVIPNPEITSIIIKACPDCHVNGGMVYTEGCETCTVCGYSKCG